MRVAAFVEEKKNEKQTPPGVSTLDRLEQEEEEEEVYEKKGRRGRRDCD